MPPLLGNVEYMACAKDDEFFEKLRERKFDVVFFCARGLPVQCRWTGHSWRQQFYKGL